MKRILLAGAALWLALLAPSCGKRDQFFPIYYLDRTDLAGENRQGGPCSTLEEARAWVYRTAAVHGDPKIRRGDYEIGKNPVKNQPLASHGITIYEETLR